jgi:hypothetical protein
MEKEKSLRNRFAQAVEAAFASDQQDDRPTVPDTVAPPLVSKRRKARLARRGAAGKKTANKAEKRRSAADTGTDFNSPPADLEGQAYISHACAGTRSPRNTAR